MFAKPLRALSQTTGKYQKALKTKIYVFCRGKSDGTWSERLIALVSSRHILLFTLLARFALEVGQTTQCGKSKNSSTHCTWGANKTFAAQQIFSFPPSAKFYFLEEEKSGYIEKNPMQKCPAYENIPSEKHPTLKNTPRGCPKQKLSGNKKKMNLMPWQQ